MSTNESYKFSDYRQSNERWGYAIDGQLVNGYVFDWGEYFYALWYVDGWAAPFVTDSGQSDIHTDGCLPKSAYFDIFHKATVEPRISVQTLIESGKVKESPGAKRFEHPTGVVLPMPSHFTHEQLCEIGKHTVPMLESKPCLPSPSASSTTSQGFRTWLAARLPWLPACLATLRRITRR